MGVFNGNDNIWDAIKFIRLYMPLMLLVAVPRVNVHFFDVMIFRARGIEQQLLGTDTGNGISDEKLQELKLASFQFIFKGILMNLNQYNLEKHIEVPALGCFKMDDSIPSWMSIAHDVQQTLQECINNTFLKDLQ